MESVMKGVPVCHPLMTGAPAWATVTRGSNPGEQLHAQTPGSSADPRVHNCAAATFLPRAAKPAGRSTNRRAQFEGRSCYKVHGMSKNMRQKSVDPCAASCWPWVDLGRPGLTGADQV